MSRKMQQTFKLMVLAAALCAVYGPAFADGPESSVSVGIGNWSNDRHQGGIFDGMRDNGGYLLLDADVLKRDDATGTWLGLKLRNLGLDNREVRAEWQRQGDIGASLEYSRIPRDNQWLFNTGVTGIGSTRLTVPSASIVPGSGSNVELGTVRDRYTVKFFKNFGSDLKFNASFRNEDKDGTRQWGRGGDPEFAVEPISSTTRQLEAILSYSRGPLQLSGGYYGTSYSNAHGLVVTALSTPTANTTYNLSLPLGNLSHEVFVNGGYNFTPTTRGTFKASYSRATQNEVLPTSGAGLTWGTSTSCDASPLLPADSCAPDPAAPKNLNGRIDTTLLEAGVTSKPMANLSIAANLRYRNLADKTPIRGVVFDHDPVPGTITVYNTPWSYKNWIGKLEANYRLQQGYSLLGGVEINNQDRWVPTLGTLYVPFRSKLDETTYRVQLKKSMSETVNGSLVFAHSKRDGGNYTVPGDPGEPYEDLINPLNIADRKRNKWRGMLDWAPSERVNLQFAIEDSRDKYSGLPYGLQKGTGTLYSVDGSFQLSQDWSLHAWYSRDENNAKELTQREAETALASRDRSAAGEAEKHNDLSEIGNSFGVGVRGMAFGKLKVGGDVEQFRSVNKYRQDVVVLDGGQQVQTNFAGTVTSVPLPNITNKMLRLKLFAQYPLQKNADLRFSLIYEEWRTDDWSWTMFPVTGATPFAYGTTKDGTTVTANPKQSSTFVSVRYIYKFE